MAIDKFGSPYSISDDEDISRPMDDYTPITTGSATAPVAAAVQHNHSFSPFDGMSDADEASLGAAGIGAASTTAKSLLNSIAAQNAINFAANQGSLKRQSQGVINQQDRTTQAQELANQTSQSGEHTKLSANDTLVNATLGGQGNENTATRGIVDQLAQIMSGNTKKRFGA